MRGDRPFPEAGDDTLIPATPHARGSTRPWLHGGTTTQGYPACAGIDLVCSSMASNIRRLPRMRGDRP